MGISSLSDLSPGLLPMLIINAAIFVAAIKQMLCSLFPSLGFVASDYNMEAAECSEQQMHDDEGGLDRMNISVGSQLTNPLSFEGEILGKSPPLTFSFCFCNEDCAVCLCTLGEGDGISKLPCCHLFHRCCVKKWLDYQGLQPTCPLCRSAQVTANMFSMIGQDELT